MADRPIDIGRIDHGLDFVATVRVRNTSNRRLEQLALTHIVPSGWEIHGTASGPAAPSPA